MLKYILDTDIGDDIDDAFALDLALKKNLPLIGITTVFKNTEERARIAKKAVTLYGKPEIPVYAGLSTLNDVNNCETERCCQWTEDLKENIYNPSNYDANSGKTNKNAAVDFIVDNAKKYGKDLIIMAIGPMANVAAAIKKDEKAMSDIGGIVMMGGDYVNQYTEWNIFCDVAAAEIVFTSKIDITAFGHEVTSKFKLSEKQQNYIFNMDKDAYHSYLAELSRLWLASKPEGWRIVLHDVLVTRYASEKFGKMKEITVHLETLSPYVYGMTANLNKFDLINSPAGKKITVAYDPDIDEIIDTEMKLIGYRED